MIQKPTDILKSWAPMPRYLLRRFVIREIVRRLDPSDFIEIGAGTGELAKWMSDRRIAGVVVDTSPTAIQMLHARLDDTPIEICGNDVNQLDRQADLVVSMEVLEHIEDDRQALRDWFDRVRPGGNLVLSVPSRQKLFSIHDEMVGHYRRYEKAELSEKLREAGFRSPTALSYGFPLALLTRHLRNYMARRKARSDQRSYDERTAASGVERDFVGLRWMLNDYFFWPFQLIQIPFLRLDWSEGYVVVAERPESDAAARPAEHVE